VRRLTSSILMAAAGILSCEASAAYAQVLGTFRWQFAPYCNVITVRVEQKGAVYEFLGTDDGCDGAAPASAVNGSAHLNVGGSAGGSLAVVRPDGFVVTNAVILSPATLAGTWRDDWGNSGTLVFNPPSPAAGSPRPLSMRGEYSVVDTAAAGNSLGYTSIGFPRPLTAGLPPSAVTIVTFGSAPTASCPGSVTNPLAAPGQLCFYERVRTNISNVLAFSSATAATGTSAHGVTMAVSSTGAGSFGLYGRWVVTVP
jgi:hypothetical protein